MDAREIEKFQESHRKEIDAHLKSAIKVDPTLSESILSVDEKFVQSIEGLDEAQKKEIWRALKSAQDDLKKREGK